MGFELVLKSRIQSASINYLSEPPCVSMRVGMWVGAEFLGAVAQLGERLICIQEVAGSIPTSSTRWERSCVPGAWRLARGASLGPVAQVARAHP
jgi:hypothetical protein